MTESVHRILSKKKKERKYRKKIIDLCEEDVIASRADGTPAVDDFKRRSLVEPPHHLILLDRQHHTVKTHLERPATLFNQGLTNSWPRTGNQLGFKQRATVYWPEREKNVAFVYHLIFFGGIWLIDKTEDFPKFSKIYHVFIVFKSIGFRDISFSKKKSERCGDLDFHDLFGSSQVVHNRWHHQSTLLECFIQSGRPRPNRWSVSTLPPLPAATSRYFFFISEK